MKKILVYTENYARGGGNRYMIDCINALRETFNNTTIASNPQGVFNEDLKRCIVSYKKIEVPVITMSRISNSLSKYPRLLRASVMVPVLALTPILFLYNCIILLLMILSEKPSVILCCNGGYPGGWSVQIMTVVAKCMGIPCYLSIVSMPVPRRCSFIDRLIDKCIWWATEKIIVNAQAIKSEIFKLREAPLDKIVVVHNGLEKVKSVYEKGKIDKELIVGFIARMDYAKGCFVLLEAFGHLVKRWPNLRLVLVGKGNASEEMTMQIKNSDLKEKVDIFGYYEGDINELLCTFDIYTFPSLHEGFPYSILEAMRLGKCIVSTNVGGIPEALQHERSGLLVEPNNVNEIVKAIDQILCEPQLINKFGIEAKTIFEKHFIIKVMHEEISKIFNEEMK